MKYLFETLKSDNELFARGNIIAINLNSMKIKVKTLAGLKLWLKYSISQKEDITLGAAVILGGDVSEQYLLRVLQDNESKSSLIVV